MRQSSVHCRGLARKKACLQLSVIYCEFTRKFYLFMGFSNFFIMSEFAASFSATVSVLVRRSVWLDLCQCLSVSGRRCF